MTPPPLVRIALAWAPTQRSWHRYLAGVAREAALELWDAWWWHGDDLFEGRL